MAELITSQMESNNIADISKPISKSMCVNGEPILYLFSPRSMPNVTIRPLQYNFNINFVDKISELLDEDPINGSLDRIIINSDISNDVIIPDANGIDVNSNKFSQNWTFMLSFDGSSIPSHLTSDRTKFNYLNPINFKLIYFGICLDEPVNLVTLNTNISSPTYNNDAKLIVTRKCVFRTGNIRNTSAKTSSVMIDNLKTPYVGIYNSDDIFSIAPCDICRDLRVTDSHDRYDSTLFLNSLKESKIDLLSTWELPKQNLSTIVNSIESGANYLKFETEGIHPVENRNPLADDMMRTEIIDNLLVSNSAEYSNSAISNLGFLDDDYIRLEEIFAYSPQVLIVKNQDSTQLSLANESGMVSPETVFSSLLEQVIPAILIKWNLASISFLHETYSNYLEIYQVEGLGEVSPDVLKYCTNGFIHNLKREAFDIMKTNGGDFQLSVMSSLYGSSLINLVFHDFKSLGNEDFIEHPNSLGGITSNNIGNIEHINKNYSELLTVINHVTESSMSPIEVDATDTMFSHDQELLV